MTADGVLVITLVIFLLMAALEVPIAVSLIVAGASGVVMLRGSDLAMSVLASVPFSSTSSYSLFAIPAFVLLGAVISNSGIARHMFAVVNKITRRVPAGVAVTTVGATTMMSGISGSSAADVASMGRLCTREMVRVGYSLPQSAAVVAAAGAFAALIPPSIGLVLYAIIAGVSVGQMLLAGIVPGLLSAAALMGFLMVQAKLKQRREVTALIGGGRPGADELVTEVATAEELAVDEALDPIKNTRGQLTAMMIALAIFLVVLGGLYAGFLTATEAAGAGALVAILLVGLFPRARDTTFRRILTNSLTETVSTSSMIFLLVVGGSIVTYLVVAASLPERIAGTILELPVAPTVVIAIFLVILMLLGTVLDGLSIMLLTVPIVAPVVVELGFDPIWFGILFMKMVEIGLITPPVGINVYVVSGMFKGLRPERVFRAVTPYVLLDIAVVAVLFAFPGIITWLPNTAG